MKETFEKIRFRALEEKDIPLVRQRLQYDYVSQRYHAEESFDLQKTKLLHCIHGIKPTQPFVVQYDGIDIGYMQFYRNSDYPEYQKEIDYYDDACGIDMFIGEKEYLHKGIGPLMIMKFLRDIAFPRSGLKTCVLGPDPNNTAAIKAYEKVGFVYIKTVTKDDGREYIMTVTAKTIDEKIASPFSR